MMSRENKIKMKWLHVEICQHCKVSVETAKSETRKVDRKVKVYSSSQNYFGKVFSFTSLSDPRLLTEDWWGTCKFLSLVFDPYPAPAQSRETTEARYTAIFAWIVWRIWVRIRAPCLSSVRWLLPGLRPFSIDRPSTQENLFPFCRSACHRLIVDIHTPYESLPSVCPRGICWKLSVSLRTVCPS